MKILTKYILIILTTLPVSGCFQEDDKSYVEVGKVAENAAEEVKPITRIECWMYDMVRPTHTFTSTKNAGRMVGNSGQIVLGDGTRLPIANCIMTKI